MDDNTGRLDWKILVESYLAACFEDRKSASKAKLSNAQADVFDKHGSDLIREMYIDTAEDALNSLTSYPVANQWKIIEEDENRIVVEIPGNDKKFPNRVPSLDTRILLMRPRGEWKIHDVLNPCSRCNLIPKPNNRPGKCFACNGNGTFGEPDPLVRSIGKPCSVCKGTGGCPKCAAESLPGWRRVFFLEKL